VTENFDVHISSIIGGILVIFIHITRLASNEIFSPSNKIHREVGRAKVLISTLVVKVRSEDLILIVYSFTV